MSAKPWWSGFHVKITYPENLHPWIFPYLDSAGSIRLHGTFGALIGNVTASMNMTYEAITADDGQYGHYLPNGSFTGMLKMVHSGRADLATGPFTPYIQLFEAMHLTPHCGATKIQILSGMKHAFITRSTPYTRAFDTVTWMAIWASFTILTALIIIEEWLVLKRRLDFVMITDNLFVMMQTWLQEATKKRCWRLRFAFRRFNYGYTQMIGVVWLLTTFVIMQFFTCDLKANSVVKSPTLRLNNIHDLIQYRHKYK
ncbi:glutamate receptor delta-1 subunit-like, partial [Tropilaelaps mercedesae]